MNSITNLVSYLDAFSETSEHLKHFRIEGKCIVIREITYRLLSLLSKCLPRSLTSAKRVNSLSVGCADNINLMG